MSITEIMFNKTIIKMIIKMILAKIKEIGYWMYAEIMATFKPEPYIHICQNYRHLNNFPFRWHKNYMKFENDS